MIRLAFAVLNLASIAYLAWSFWWSRRALRETLVGWCKTLEDNRELIRICQEQAQRIRELSGESVQ